MKTGNQTKIMMLSAGTVLLLCGGAMPGYAQEGQAQSADDFLSGNGGASSAASSSTQGGGEQKSPERIAIEKSMEEAKAELQDKEVAAKKLELAKQMHEIRPTRDQVDAAVNRAATMLPQYEQRSFVNAMKTMLNYNAIERISIDAMVETYTLKELEAMVAYYSLPEAKSASFKMGAWAQRVQPEIVRMIDKAMIRIRTGQ